MQKQLNAAVRACQENSAGALEQLQRALQDAEKVDLATSGEVQKIFLPRAMVTSHLYFFITHMHARFIAVTLHSTICRSLTVALSICAQLMAARPYQENSTDAPEQFVNAAQIEAEDLSRLVKAASVKARV